MTTTHKFPSLGELLRTGGTGIRLFGRGCVDFHVSGQVVLPAELLGTGGTHETPFLRVQLAVQVQITFGGKLGETLLARVGHDLRRKFMSCGHCQELGQLAVLASDWLFTLLQPIRSQVSSLTQLLTMTTSQKFPPWYM